ncbi:Peroxisome size and maintenance regulator [Lecanora helva]
MDEFTADAFVNREEPIPAIAVSGSETQSSDSKGKRERVKESLAGGNSKLKDKLQDAGSGSNKYGYSLQDRLFSKLLQQVIPAEEIEELDLAPDVRSSKYINRPSFSLPLMTNNFRRFNARIGVIFVFQNRVERLLTWRTPSHTLSFLAVCTFVCLDPYLLSVLPLAAVLLFVMVPAYLARHPPPPSSKNYGTYAMNGPPLAPARTIKPAGEMSKDFFRNMRDLQNSMDDFSTVHDLILKIITPPTNFSNEPLSSTIFLFLFVSSCLLFITSHLLPWRFLALIVCWTATALGHPSVQQLLLSNHEEHLAPHERTAQSWLDAWISHDIILDAPPETREVEVFELQRRKGGPNGEWESWMFSPTPYDPLSPQRISGDRPKGTRFFEDVEPPKGWEWGDKKWVLDLASQDWVEERMVQGVEVEIEGERWVGDLAEKEGTYEMKTLKKGKAREWEEGSGHSKMGDWRRRRWVRMVRRKVVSENSTPGNS